MDAKSWTRLGAAVFASAAIAAAVLETARKEEGAAPQVSRSSEDTPSDPLRAAQRRCQLLGEAAAREAECLRVWAETRDRFLGTTAPTSPQLHHWR